MDSTPRNSIEASGKKGAAIIARLEALRDAHRLGIHMWEKCAAYEFPKDSYDDLKQFVPGKTCKPALISFSLLPSKNDGVTMLPYVHDPDDAGYLLDLSDDQPNTPVVVAATPGIFCSGNDVYDKSYFPQAAGCSLDELAEIYPHQYTRSPSYEGVALCNEALAPIGHEHTVAIMTVDRGPVWPNTSPPLQRLRAAVNGLVHHYNSERELPVVIYHVKGPNKGGFTYVGESTRELRQVAAGALEEIHKDPHLYQWLVHHDDSTALRRGLCRLLDMAFPATVAQYIVALRSDTTIGRPDKRGRA